MSNVTLRGYQEDAVRFAYKNPRCMISLTMGMGKTLLVLFLISLMRLISREKILVISTKRVVKVTWPTEIREHSDFKDIRYSVIVGTKKQREEALSVDADIYLINFEQLPFLVDYFGEHWPFKFCVIDESTKLKGFRPRQGAKRAKAFAKVAHKYVERIILLTGTPSPNGLIDLYGQYFFISPDIFGLSWQRFIDTYFKTVRVGASSHAVRYEPLPHSQKAMEQKIAPYTFSIDPKDYFDVKTPIENVIKVDLPPDARSIYNDMEKEMFVELGQLEVEAFSAGALTTKVMQIASGSLYTDGKDYAVIHDEKIDALASVIEEANGMPLIVAYHFKSDLERLMAAFPQGRHLDDDPKTVDDFNKGRIPVLFLHPASAGHGLSLHHGTNQICFFTNTFSLENYLQAVERCGPIRQLQAGYDRPVFIHHIVATDTIDELIMQRLKTKETVQELLLNAMRQYRRKHATQ